MLERRFINARKVFEAMLEYDCNKDDRFYYEFKYIWKCLYAPESEWQLNCAIDEMRVVVKENDCFSDLVQLVEAL